MKIEVKLNQPAIEAIQRAMQDAALEAMGLLRTEVTTAQVMPFDTGTMQNARTAVVQDGLPDTGHRYPLCAAAVSPPGISLPDRKERQRPR